MVMAIETWTGKKGARNAVRLEDMVVVRKDGYELLSRWPIDELIEVPL
jgi:Xaa-Pro aminopeptidase